MKAIELREMTLEELAGMESDLEEELTQYRIQLSIRRLDNPIKVRQTRRELARVKTIINEKRKEEAGSEA
ncbi:MAG: 50S ribosomal protein L29 [Candidatus Latescibacteria bacterium]|nr:50S ribosomal protein L29 [bacterium]MBD3425232.1 50S ribosomal protein L29 [Candidatus Latescibacterota bacterium]